MNFARCLLRRRGDRPRVAATGKCNANEAHASVYGPSAASRRAQKARIGRRPADALYMSVLSDNRPGAAGWAGILPEMVSDSASKRRGAPEKRAPSLDPFDAASATLTRRYSGGARCCHGRSSRRDCFVARLLAMTANISHLRCHCEHREAISVTRARYPALGSHH
jgi:hypothetical protein